MTSRRYNSRCGLVTKKVKECSAGQFDAEIRLGSCWYSCQVWSSNPLFEVFYLALMGDKSDLLVPLEPLFVDMFVPIKLQTLKLFLT